VQEACRQGDPRERADRVGPFYSQAIAGTLMAASPPRFCSLDEIWRLTDDMFKVEQELVDPDSHSAAAIVSESGSNRVRAFGAVPSGRR